MPIFGFPGLIILELRQAWERETDGQTDMVQSIRNGAYSEKDMTCGQRSTDLALIYLEIAVTVEYCHAQYVRRFIRYIETRMFKHSLASLVGLVNAKYSVTLVLIWAC